MNRINTKLKLAAVALFLGTTTVAAAQTPNPAHTFAGELQQFQTLSGTGTYTYNEPPTLGNEPQNPIGNESFSQRFADMQAASSKSSQWQETQPTLTATAADPEGREPFAQRFAEMQAASSKSGQWSFQPGANVPADEANSTLVVAKPIGHPLSSRIAVSQK